MGLNINHSSIILHRRTRDSVIFPYRFWLESKRPVSEKLE
jgi:hypothetical protein